MPSTVARDALALRQDLSDVIHIADKKKTVFLSQVPKGPTITNLLQEWPVDNYPTPNTTGAVDEKDVQDWENLNAVAAVLQGRLQILERKPRVSRLMETSTNQAGVGQRKAFAKAMAKGLVMLARDTETTLLSDNESALGTGTTGSQTRGLGKWISSSAQTDLPVSSDFRTPSGSISTTAIAAITDDTVTAVLQSMFDQTGDSDMKLVGICGSTIKRAFSGLTYFDKNADSSFLPLRRYNSDAADKTMTVAVDLLDTDFGNVALRLSSFINASGAPTSAASKRLCYVVPMEEEMIRVRYADGPRSDILPNMGGGPRALIQSTFNLEVGNPLAFAKFVPSA
jgi:hypothetical protein